MMKLHARDRAQPVVIAAAGHEHGWLQLAGLSLRLARLPAMTGPSQQPRGRRRGWVIYWVLLGVTVLALVGGVLTVHLTGGAFTEPSTGMENTVRPGDLVIAAHTAQVHRGDVIVEQQTVPAPGTYLRRVVGLPGDHVVCCDARGRITVNGKPLDESYLYPGDAPSQVQFKVTVPKGHLWLLGDHRSVAYDSRALGPLVVHVVGRVVLVLGPGYSAFLGPAKTFVADGLAPADEGTPAALVGAMVSLLAFPLLIALVIIGVACFVIGRIRRRRKRNSPSAAMSQPAMPDA
jgi:signal peptidase I